MANDLVLTDAGRKMVQHLVQEDNNYSKPTHIGWGTGAGSASTADESATELDTEAGTRQSASFSYIDTSVDDDTLQATATMTHSGESATYNEVGLFTASTDGTMMLYGIFTEGDAITLNDGDSIAFTLKWQLA